jgi:hypothetical protein
MSNLTVRKNNIEAALAIAKQNRVERSEPRVSLIEIYVPRVCAQHDREYLVVYTQGANKLYTLSRYIRTAGGISSEAGNHSAAAMDLESQMIDRATEQEKCPWCGVTGRTINGMRVNVVACGRCKGYICLGRTDGAFFQCRASCGAWGELSDKSVPSRALIRQEAAPCPSGAELGSQGDHASSRNQLRLSSGAR